MQKIAATLGDGDVGTMLAAMNPGAWTSDIARMPGCQIGVISGSGTAVLKRAGIGPGLLHRGEDVIAVSGLPLDPKIWSKISCAADLQKFLPGVDGTFAAIGWSPRERKLYIVCDFLGLQPIYFSQENGFRVATETKAFPYDPDAAGWSAWLTCMHMIGHVTINRHARRVPPSAKIEISENGELLESRYWRWPAEGAAPDAADVVDALEQNVRAYSAIAPDAVCMLSGGFDSRLILALLKRAAIPTRAMIIAHNDYWNQDGLLAKRVARQAGVDFEVVNSSLDFFSSKEFLHYLWAQEVEYPSLDLFIAQLHQFLDGTPIWDGLIPAGTLRTAVQRPPGDFGAFVRRACAGADSPQWQAAKILFRPPFFETLRTSFDELFARTRAPFPDTPYGFWQWAREHRLPTRAGINPTKVYPNRASTLILGTSQEFYRMTATIPFEERSRYQYYLALFEKMFPSLAAIPFDSGGELHATSSAHMAHRLLVLRQRANQFLTKRPRLMRMLGLRSQRFRRSVFLQNSRLFDEEDPLLNMDAVRKLKTNEQMDDKARELLFHWRAARWIHEGRLYSTFEAEA